MKLLNKKFVFLPGIALCFLIAVFAYFLGTVFPVIGGPVFAIVFGLILSTENQGASIFKQGISFSSKYLLQLAVVLLGFGMNLNLVVSTGRQSLPVIISTISTSLLVAFCFHKIMKIPTKTAILVGVGSSICGGSAIAATAPVIKADDDEIAQSITVIFIFNILAALLFPSFGNLLGFSHQTGSAFGLFAGTAINDTSSVTAAASTWDLIHHLGNATLKEAVTVKLTRTLAIIPITAILGIYFQKDQVPANGKQKRMALVPPFILLFLGACAITTLCSYFKISSSIFYPFSFLSKFLIIVAMGAIGLGANLNSILKNSKKPLLLGFLCWIFIILVSLLVQHFIIGDF